jgi:hypothetical protein
MAPAAGVEDLTVTDDAERRPTVLAVLGIKVNKDGTVEYLVTETNGNDGYDPRFIDGRLINLYIGR